MGRRKLRRFSDATLGLGLAVSIAALATFTVWFLLSGLTAATVN